MGHLTTEAASIRNVCVLGTGDDGKKALLMLVIIIPAKPSSRTDMLQFGKVRLVRGQNVNTSTREQTLRVYQILFIYQQLQTWR